MAPGANPLTLLHLRTTLQVCPKGCLYVCYENIGVVRILGHFNLGIHKITFSKRRNWLFRDFISEDWPQFFECLHKLQNSEKGTKFAWYKVRALGLGVNCVMPVASWLIFTRLFILSESTLNQLIKLIPLQVQIAYKAVIVNVNKLLFSHACKSSSRHSPGPVS